MTSSPKPSTQPPNPDSTYVPPTPLRCIVGSVISGGLATAMFMLTVSIAQTFAAKPIPSGNQLAINIAVAVRTLVVGMSTMGTAIFGVASLGLLALAVQLVIKQMMVSRDAKG